MNDANRYNKTLIPADILLKKFPYMLKYFLILLFFPLLWTSCTDDDMPYEIGSEDVDVRTHMGMIDTLTVRSYTVSLDSIPTSAVDNPAIVVGSFTDENFGTLNASSFFRVELPARSSTGFNIDEDAEFDSLRLYLIYNKYFEGDTTQPFKIEVYRLKSELEPGNDGFFYNNDSIPAFPEPIGTKTFLPSPNSGDTVWITLDPEIGADLFRKMKENSNEVMEADLFFEFFKGFMIRGNLNNKCMIGFSYPASASSNALTAMRLHYHYFDLNTINKTLNFNAQAITGFGFSLIRLQFNRFTLTNPKVQFPVSQREKLPVSLTGNRSFVMSGMGIVTRLEIPYLKELFYVGNNIRILNAQLELEPVSGTYTEDDLPRQISLHETDNINRWGLPVFDRSGSGEAAVASLVTDFLYQEKTKYTFDITGFITSRLMMQSDVIPALILHVSADDFYRTGKRLVLGSQHHSQNKVKLKLYYINVN